MPTLAVTAGGVSRTLYTPTRARADTGSDPNRWFCDQLPDKLAAGGYQAGGVDRQILFVTPRSITLAANVGGFRVLTIIDEERTQTFGLPVAARLGVPASLSDISGGGWSDVPTFWLPVGLITAFTFTP